MKPQERPDYVAEKNVGQNGLKNKTHNTKKIIFVN